MRSAVLAVVVSLGVAALFAGCPSKNAPPHDLATNLDPYRNVTPQKVKQEVEQIQDDEDKRNEARRKQAETGQ
jgi:hypothetical protein